MDIIIIGKYTKQQIINEAKNTFVFIKSIFVTTNLKKVLIQNYFLKRQYVKLSKKLALTYGLFSQDYRVLCLQLFTLPILKLIGQF